MKGERLIIENNQSLEQHLCDEANPKTRLKLAFLHCIATLSTNLSELCKSFGVAESTGYWWVRNWNTTQGRLASVPTFGMCWIGVYCRLDAGGSRL